MEGSLEMADAEQYRDWAAQQVSIRTRNALLDEADRIELRDAVRSGGAGVTIKKFGDIERNAQ